MSLMIVILLFAIALFAIIFKLQKTGIFFTVLSVVVFLFIGSGLLPSLLLKNLQQPFKSTASIDFAAKRNAIVMLGAGNIKIPSTSSVRPTLFSYSRIYKTASLYYLCKKNQDQCTIILSGGDPLKTGKSEAMASREELLTLPIQSNDIILEANSLNTFKNAEFTSQILKLKPYDQVILVTSGFHMRRALLYFSNFAIYPKPAISDYISPIITLLPQAYNFALTDFAVHEYIGILRYYFYDYMHWNVIASNKRHSF